MAMSWQDFQDVLSANGVDPSGFDAPSVDEGMDTDMASFVVSSAIGRALARMAWKACRADVDRLADAVTDVVRQAERAVQRFGALSCDEYASVAFRLDEIADDLRHDALVLSRVANDVGWADPDVADHAQTYLYGFYAASADAADGAEG